MMVVKWLWAIDFFFFALVLFFIWSKKTIVAGRVSALTSMLKAIEEVEKPRQARESEKTPASAK